MKKFWFYFQASSVIYLVLCIVALISRFDCNVGAPDSVSGSGYFLNIVYRAYIQGKFD